MNIVHLANPDTAPLCDNRSYYGGLERFLEDIVAFQMGEHNVSLIQPNVDVFKRASQSILSEDWNCLYEIGKEVVGRYDADVYHIHDWYGGICLEYLYRRGLRNIVMTSHLPLRRGFTYKDTTADWRAKFYLEDIGLNGAKKIICASQYNADFLVSEYGLEEKKIHIIPLGVDTRRFKPVQGDPPSPLEPHLLFVGRLIDQKAPQLLIRAMPEILDAFPKARLTIVGSGPDFGRVERLIEEKHLTEKIRMAGLVDRATLLSYYSNSTLLIIPSQFEPFGLVGIEAMACGCPVFGISPGGISAYLYEHEMTRSYSPRRLGRAIIDRLNKLAKEPNHRIECCRRAEKFSWEKQIDLYERVYEEVAR